MSQWAYVTLVLGAGTLNAAALGLSYLPGFYDTALTAVYLTGLAAPFVVISRYFGLGYPARWLIIPVALLLFGLFALVATIATSITGGGGGSASFGQQLAFAGLFLSLGCFAVIAFLGLFPHRLVGPHTIRKYIPFSKTNEVPK